MVFTGWLVLTGSGLAHHTVQLLLCERTGSVNNSLLRDFGLIAGLFPDAGAGNDYQKDLQFRKLNAQKDIIEVTVTRGGQTLVGVPARPASAAGMSSSGLRSQSCCGCSRACVRNYRPLGCCPNAVTVWVLQVSTGSSKIVKQLVAMRPGLDFLQPLQARTTRGAG